MKSITIIAVLLFISFQVNTEKFILFDLKTNKIIENDKFNQIKFQNNHQLVMNKFDNVNSLFFRKNTGFLLNNLTLFYIKMDQTLIEFQKSRILISVTRSDMNKKYYIHFELVQSNTIDPIGLKPTNYSTVIYHNIEEITQIYEYENIKYNNIYPNIDLLFYINSNNLKYNFIVHPNGNPKDIIFKINSDLKLDISNNSINLFDKLVPDNSIFTDSNLFSFQDSKKEISSQFEQKMISICSTCYGFTISNYNLNKDLIIDPYWIIRDQEVVSSYNESDFKANGFLLDSNGNIVLLGCVLTDKNDYDIVVSKYSNLGVKVNISYIRGSFDDCIDTDKRGKSLFLDQFDNIYITGYTLSVDFPIKDAIQESNNGNEDAFLVKLDNNLNLLFSSYFGGSQNDRGRSITVKENSIFLTGVTNSLDFPLKDAIQPTYNGGDNDAFIIKTNNYNLSFSTYFGGNSNDEIHASILDETGNLIITGETTSRKFNITEYVIQETFSGIYYPDAFITKISNDGQKILFSTYFGGTSSDEGNDLLIDKNGDILVLGSTSSDIINDISAPKRFTIGILSYSRVFIAKIKNDGLELRDFIVLGGNGNDFGLSFTMDKLDNLIITGNTYSSNFWVGIPIYTGQIPNNYTKSFVTKIDLQKDQLDMSSIIYKQCNYFNCLYTSQDILIDNNNSVYILGNNKLIENNVSFSYRPFLTKLSELNDETNPQISLLGYQIEKSYSPGTNLTVKAVDPLSGIKIIEYFWKNDSIFTLTEPYIITLPDEIGIHELTIQVIDNAGNIGLQNYKITIISPDYSSIIMIGISIVFSIITAYISIHVFWKYYFSKKRAVKSYELKNDDVNDYMKLLSKNKDLMEELKKDE